MASYFDKINDRFNTDSCKWDVEKNQLAMTIGDSDFQTSPAIKKALIKRAKSGIYGYTDVSDEWYNAYINFFSKHYNLNFTKENLMFVTGVVPAISSAVRKLSNIGDNVVVLSPVYNIFYNSIRNNKRKILEVPLIYSNYSYSINFNKLEEAFKNEKTSLMILCNPHNPVSKIFTKEELRKIGELAYKYKVKVFSDEIHSQLTRPKISYIPFASVNATNRKISLTAISPTKTFNLAGIHTAAILSYSKSIYKRINRQINTDEVAEPTVFSCIAAIKAFTKSENYLKKLRKYIYNNVDYVYDYLEKNIPELVPVKGNATYFVWIDISKISDNSIEFTSFLKEKTGLIITPGAVFSGNGNSFVRINLSTPFANVQKAMELLKEGVILFKNREKSE